MKRILKRFATTDPFGRTLAYSTERLVDDGRGRLQVTALQSAHWCPGCRRPIRDLGDVRGLCDFCRFRGVAVRTCIHCETRCQCCARRLCGGCRRGFAGPPALTVCPICLAKLHRRQAFQDRTQLRQEALARRVALEREWARIQAVRLQAARLRAVTRIQAARLKLTGQLAMMRELHRMRLNLARPGHVRVHLW